MESHFYLTHSTVGQILHRRPDTPPDSLVLSILQPRSFYSAATEWGVANKSKATEAYISQQHQAGNVELTVEPCGFFISESHPFLGATPDGSVYDPSNLEQPYGFLEIKFPYTQRDRTPLEACQSPGFCCEIDSHGQVLKLRKNHLYYAQVQGQMAIGGRPWCDFVVHTNKGTSIERIHEDKSFWSNTLLPKLECFFDTCLAPEVISPVHVLGLPLHKLD